MRVFGAAKWTFGLAPLLVILLAAPASAEPTLGLSLINTPTSLPRNDERMEYQAIVANTASATPSVGDTLTCKNSLAQWSKVSSEADFAYSWLRNGNEIAGASEKTYVIGAVDEGQGIQCRIVATQPEAKRSVAFGTGDSVSGSNKLTALAAARGTGTLTTGSSTITGLDVPSGKPFLAGQAISGTGIPAGTTITAVGAGTLELSAATTASGTQKLTAGGTPFAVGQTIDAFSFGQPVFPQGTTITAVEGQTLTLSESATQTASEVFLATQVPGATVSLSTVFVTAPVVIAPQPATGPPMPVGAFEVSPEVIPVGGVGGLIWDDETRFCQPPKWTTGTTFTYQWLRNGEPIPGATSPEYTPVEVEDEAVALQCEVRGKTGTGTSPSGGESVGVSSSNAWIVALKGPPNQGDRTVIPPNNFGSRPVVSFANASSGEVTLDFEAPPGLDTTIFNASGAGWSCNRTQPVGAIPGSVHCTRSDGLSPAASYPPVRVVVHLGKDAPEPSGTAFATVSGGGAADPASDDATYTFTEPTPFGIIPGSFEAGVFDELGNDHTTAGGHPFSAFTTFGFNVRTVVLGSGGAKGVTPVETVKDVVVDAPRGFVGNALAAPELCQTVEEVLLGICPPKSAVGGITVYAPATLNIPDENPYLTGKEKVTTPIYSVEPEFGQPAQFAFAIVGLAPYTFVPELRPSEGYAISFRTAPIIAYPPLFGSDVTLCDFGAQVKEPEGPSEYAKFLGCHKATDAQANPMPLITNPTRCSGPPPSAALRINSWERPKEVKTYDFTAPQITDCEAIEFTPEAQLTPTNRQADSPTGLDVEITMPVDGVLSPTGVSQANLNTVKVTFPKGMSINGAAAEGLGACSLAQVKLQSNAPDECPESSKVGTIEIDTPLIRETLHGDVYVARQADNPFNATVGLYMVFSSARDGVTIKVAGRVEPDPATGQLVSTFTENPEAPFSRLALSFNSGPRAPLVNPPKCGTYDIRAEFSPWSAVNPANPTPSEIVVDKSTYKVTRGPNNGACPAGDLAPTLRAGLADPTAAAKSPFTLSLSREDGTQRFTGLEVDNPKGLTAYLKGVGICPESSLAGVSAAEGAAAAEIASPSCPSSSLVGSVIGSSGAGSLPFYVKTGKVYLAGPYKGAPVSLAALTPALAGPYDLGNVLVRVPLYVDPVSAQVKAVSDPIPTALHGIALNLREIRVALDRPGFTAAPTSCEPSAVEARVQGADGGTASVSSRFQVGGCERLGFKPRLSLRLFGGTTRGAHPRLRATVRPRPGDAHIAAAAVTLPRSAFLDQGHIRTVCTRVQFAADQCPAASVYGQASATTPLLDAPLTGPVYLRSSDNELPDLVAALRGPDSQPIEVELIGRIDSVNRGIRSSFETAPDQPVTSFTLTMQGGKKGLLINSRNLCKGKAARAKALFSAHNGKEATLRPVMGNGCKQKRKRGR